MSALLPATLAEVPEDALRFTYRGWRELPTSDGLAFNVEVFLDGEAAGTLENEGRGGGTWFRHLDREAMHTWEDVTRDYLALTGETWQEAWNDLAAEEANMQAVLNRGRTPALLMPEDKPRDGWRKVRGGASPAAMLQSFPTARVWCRGVGWRPVAEAFA